MMSIILKLTNNGKIFQSHWVSFAFISSNSTNRANNKKKKLHGCFLPKLRDLSPCFLFEIFFCLHVGSVGLITPSAIKSNLFRFNS